MKILNERAIAKALTCRSGWFSLFTINTKSGIRDAVCRNNRLTDACKVMPLFLSEKQYNKFSLRGKVKLSQLVKEIKGLKESPGVGILACDRPLTYFPNSGVSRNYVFEFPGGVVEYGEKIKAAGIREMMEELGLKKKQVLCFAKLLPRACNDQGTHVEWTNFVVAVCVGKMRPPKEEGIIPSKCPEITLEEIPEFIRKQEKRKIGFEGHILSAYNAFMMAHL